MYIYTNIIGSFVFDQKLNIIDKIQFSFNESKENMHLLSRNKGIDSEKKLLEKYPDAKKVASPLIINKILEKFKGNAKDFYDINIINTRRLISESVSDDDFIIQAVKTIETLDKTANSLVKRLRDWYELYLPEASNDIADNESFTKVILSKSRDELRKELDVTVSMGTELAKPDLDEIIDLAKMIKEIYEQRSVKEEYIAKVMKRLCPNTLEITGTMIGAKMFAQAGSLHDLVFMPASTIQLLGAEEALFRHIKTGSRPPKYGILLQHKLVAGAKKEMKGKVAKALADKISIAVKVDYFKGEPIGHRLYEELKKKFG